MASFCKVSVMAFHWQSKPMNKTLASHQNLLPAVTKTLFHQRYAIICFNASRSWMGDKCHTAITNAVISRPEFSGNATLFRTRSEETWTTCSRLVEIISPGPSA
ncbi:hypothetical protein AAG906_004643 [Vitis piasezkii]